MIDKRKPLGTVVENEINDEGMMINENFGEFITFVNLCLVHFTTSQTWRYKYYNTDISNIFTVTDGILAILLL